MSNPTYILGGHQTDFARVWSREGLDFSDMMRETALGALEACALDVSAIESIHVGNAMGELYRQQGHMSAVLAQIIPEFHGIPSMRHEAACASSSMAVLSAMAEIESGRYDCVLVLGVEEEKNIPGDAAALVQNCASWQGREDLACRFMWPAVFGRIAIEYEQRYGLDRRHLRRIAEINFANAKRNPKAQTRRWVFSDESFADDDRTNPLIEPGTRRSDCSQITDGACALILASAKFAAAHRSAGSQTAAILGWGHRTAGIRFLDKLERSRDQTYVMPHVRQTIVDAWRRARIAGVEDLDGVETHDCFTATEYLAIDHFGLTEPGLNGRAIDEGWLERGGKLPFNASGGLMGVGHPVGATGARMLFDASKQVTGMAQDCQIEGARTVQTLNIGGSFGTVASFVVGIRP